jgi:hypothetical protein
MRKILGRAAFGVAPLTVPLLAWLASCSRTPAEEPPPPVAMSPSATPSATTSMRSPGPSNLPLHWDDPPRWKRGPVSSPMRVAEYVVPSAARDSADAECTVITFGSNQGGGVENNVDRWVRQFNPLSGAPSKATRQVGGMNVTRVEVAGSYHPMAMPGGPSGASTLPDARLVGAIVEAPSGLWFFKLTGPDNAVKAAAAEFDAMIGSLR